MKRILSVCLLLTVALSGVLAGCMYKERDALEDGQLSIVTTIFPIYDWAQHIAGRHAKVTLLLDRGVDMHSFQPSAKDIIKLTSANLFIFIGGASDQWVKDALKGSTDPLRELNLMETLGDQAKLEEIVEGMQAEKDAEEAEYDEHIWLSPRIAASLCQSICDRLCEIDAEHAADYRINAADYITELIGLDASYRAAVNDAQVKTLLFGDRFPFRYLTEEYGLTYYAAFAGCSAESEASFQTIAFLAKKVDELDLHAIMQIETSNGSIAKTIRDTTAKKDQQILTLNSMQSVKDKKSSYLSIMRENLEVLRQALR
ncbi:MAG: zinc ABC transporter substrate-binding protein [Clostridia bacterium]|nr:zinc ABC transporter substrate-binding protein [Clostridia bacterium]